MGGRGRITVPLTFPFSFVSFFLSRLEAEAKAEVRQENFPGFINNSALRKKVGEGVLIGPTVKAGGHLVETLTILVPHAAGGGKRVVDKGHVKN